MSLVVADIGNSRIKWGRCSATAIDAYVSLPTDDADAWTAQAREWSLDGESWIVASVQPHTSDCFVRWLHERGRPVRVIESYRDLPIAVVVDHPERVGLDRLLDAVAANSRRTPNQCVAIVDAGSAVTVDFVDADGAFRGGAILPGLRLMTKALHDFTAQLPLVEIRSRTPPPGTNTVAAIETGVFHAVVGGIDRLLADLCLGDATVFLTGGDASVLAPHLRTPCRIWPEMTLEGLRLVAAK